MVDSVLIACPTYAGKRYAIVEFMEAYEAFEYPNRDMLLVDNTGDGGEYAKWLEREFHVGVQHIEPLLDFEDTFSACWKLITDYAVEHMYGWVLSLEQDVIGPPLLVDTLLNAATYVGAPFVTHTYPYHDDKPGFYQGMGCTLMSTPLLVEAMKRNEDFGIVEGAVYEVAKNHSHISLHELLPLTHLDGGGGFRQYRPITDPRVVMV
jgi:hypothetical protein